MMNLNEMDRLILDALREDMPFGDATTDAIIYKESRCSAELTAKSDGIICGLEAFKRTFELLGEVKIDFYKSDGDSVSPGDLIAKLSGSTRNILSGERTALNLLQRMSGIATETKKAAELVAHTKCRILDTRKTTPNFRLFEKSAVICGGGFNHRHCLSDGILIKDNHIMAAGGITNAVTLAKDSASFVRKIEVETETLEMVEEALSVKADIIMLDNMDIDTIKKAVSVINGKAITEASGNITLENLADVANTGVDFVSMGSIIYNAKVMDISLKNLKYI
ncbi:nicotinate-nucleotide pyrophosphorylase [carboxylating] [Alkalibacter saccharofermentans DSM 14828]|uniref:Probable nicotinate-nucleotide pyrophosphorylase [carboxylating] n=2 Tax=Alkalibacter TaxID=274470 RepID=A0A1M4TN76_9FIRM|nr:nicotinate-nucleotide pyrophosphorylase [carboxylating] [Alkalibacter saccharofermentans DSM 14828]